jgi:hypothetical protein
MSWGSHSKAGTGSGGTQGRAHYKNETDRKRRQLEKRERREQRREQKRASQKIGQNP